MPYLQLVSSFDNATDALTLLQQQAVDLVFLDIQMPGLTGLQLIKSLVQKPLFILITAYERYALEGFDLNVTDYLVKPVSLDRFIKACNKALEIYELRTKKDTGNREAPTYFFANVEYSLVKIVFSDIRYIEGLKDYIKVHLASSSKPVVTRMSMKSMEEVLPAVQFVRVHKSFIVSVAHITAARKIMYLLALWRFP
ncbi:MAG: response regulator transcription factor [Chitinophagaceae bacterium]